MIAQKWSKSQALLVLSAIVFITGSIGCEKKKDDSSKVQGFFEGLFSNRPSGGKNFIALVKLSAPPLFAVSPVTNGKAVVSSEDLEAIEAEQSAFQTEIARLAPAVKVIFGYKYVLNAFTVTGPIEDLEKLKDLGRVSSVETDGGFLRPQIQETPVVLASVGDLKNHNSVKFIGAENLFARQIKNAKGDLVALNGTGMKVGVIDTGIDYTHSMMGGPGSEDVFKNTDPVKPSALFPNKKVVGGIDLAGSSFNAAAIDFARHIPTPDANPLDEGGHGTHVAGTVAGLGDWSESYDGVAPGADLYAIKVFGAEGSTSDSVVIAGLEYAADPNRDGKTDDQLDVVNLSLGSSYGSAKILYSEAIGNLARGGTVVVASAGNSGNVDYITGAPGAVDAAISVAASIDDTLHNWQLPAVRLLLPSKGEVLAEAVEGAITKPIAEAGAVRGKLVYAGLADQDFSAELAGQIKGNVAFLDRGKVAFSEKIKRAAAAGAIGVVVANNQPGEAFVMGGDGKFDIPSIMITQEIGALIKSEIKLGDAVIEFQTKEKIMKPELVDTITSFSSKGPRSVDSLIKPEISSPGENIISAKMGGGKTAVKLSGTSMAGPHVAGAMALLKQAHPGLLASELKALLLNRAKTIKDEKGQVYPISRQGSGRVQIDQSVDAVLLTEPATLSLGEITIETRKAITRQIRVRNISKQAEVFDVRLAQRGEGLNLRNPPTQVRVEPGATREISLSMVLDATKMTELVREMDGWIVLAKGEVELSRVPVLAVARKISNVTAAGNLVVESSPGDAPKSAVTLTLSNQGANLGEALLFNLIGQDGRKAGGNFETYASRDCDIQAAGYRLIEKDVKGEKVQFLEIAAKMYEPLTHWNYCEVTVLIDSNNDQVPEQELATISMDNVPGLAANGGKGAFASVLFDADTMRKIRKKAEQDSAINGDAAKEDYTSAVVAMTPAKVLDHSTIVTIQVAVEHLARRQTGELGIKVIAQDFNGSAVEGDDYLAESAEKWMQISIDQWSQSFVGLPEKVQIDAKGTNSVHFTKGFGNSELLALFPNNLTVFSDLIQDRQLEILAPKFVAP
jgi:minor extracellular serine protease Vpr